MGTSNFVRWASGSSAQLMPIEKYKEQAVVGLVPGIADLEQANRAWLQGTAIACAIAELIVTAKGKYAGVDLSDADSNSEIANKLFECLSARIPAEIADGAIDAKKIDMSNFPKASTSDYGTVVLATDEDASSGNAGKVITADVFKKSVDKITGDFSGAVTYTEQALSDPQKAQARKNIDAVSSKELSDGLAGKQNAGDYPTRTEMNQAINANDAIPRNGSRGKLAGHEAMNAALTGAQTINKQSLDDMIINAAVRLTVQDGGLYETWQKNIVIMNADVTVAPGSKWKWVGGSAPKITARSLLVCKWAGVVGFLNLVATE